MMKRAFYRKIEEYMLSCMKDAAHDREHVYRVLYQAMMIAREEQDVDTDVLIAACLLHDIGRPEQLADPALCHALVGGDKAYSFLRECGCTEEFAAHVRQCIRTHRFRKSTPPATVEAKILFDADKLDVTGAVGIARTLVYNGTVDRPMYSTAPDGSILDGSGNEPDSFFWEYRFKLEHVYDRFYTRAGATVAARRRQAAEDFYHRMYAEISEPRREGREALAELLDD